MKILIPLLVLPLSASEPLTSSANITLLPIPAGTFTTLAGVMIKASEYDAA